MTSTVAYTAFDGAAPAEEWRDAAELFVAAFSAAPYFEDPTELATIVEWGPKHLAQGDGRLVTARHGGRLVGFALAHSLRGDAVWQGILSQLGTRPEAGVALADPSDALIVHELAVRESERGRGIAAACLSELLRDRTESQTFIGVYERATDAASMYDHWQLADIGRVPMPGDAVALHVLATPTADLASRVMSSGGPSTLDAQPA